MRRLGVLAIAFASALLVLGAGGPVAAQKGTPEAGAEGFALPAGVTAERLAAGPAAPLPPAPAVLELVRFTFAPGAVLQLPAESPSLALVAVEAGTLTARVAGPVMITRADGCPEHTGGDRRGDLVHGGTGRLLRRSATCRG